MGTKDDENITSGEWTPSNETVKHEIAITSFPEPNTETALSQTVSAWLVPLITIIGVYVVLQQYRINRLRLNHELYDKRFNLYISINEYAFEIIHKGKVFTQDEQLKYERSCFGASFLFNKEIDKFVNVILMSIADLIGEKKARVSEELINSHEKEILKELDHLNNLIEPILRIIK